MIVTIAFIIIISIVFSYIYLIYSFYKGLKNTKSFNPNQESELSQLTCIIPFRNEQDNLKQVINCLINQKLNSEYYEVILIDDYSTDNSYNLAQQLINKHSNFRLIQNQSLGKKSAIKLGVENALSPYIVTTDADCIHHPNWLYTISKYISIYKSDLIIAPVVLSPVKTFLDYFQHLDFLSLVSSGAGACEIKKPIMCNGANLVYTKELYTKSIPHVLNKYSSGDDIFLLQYAKSIKAKITFLRNQDTIVKTEPVETLNGLIRQRVRWASKSKGYSDKYTILVAWEIFLVNIISVLIPFTYFITPSLFYTSCILFLSKIYIDYKLLHTGAKILNTSFKTNTFLLIQLIYPVYITYIVLYAMIGKVRWKNRNIITENN